MNERTVSVEMVGVECGTCALTFAVSRTFHEARVVDREWFFCPYGHANQLGVESSSDRLVRALAGQVTGLERAQRELLEGNTQLVLENGRLRETIVDLTVGPMTAEEAR